jgi:hypothetical protein
METIKQQLVSSVAQAPLDNFGTFNDSVQGTDDDGHSGGILAGIRLKFTNESRWETPDGDDFTDKELTAINHRRVEVYWDAHAPRNAPPKETRELAPGERYRDLEALNETIPKSEWREGFDGKLQGPWQRQAILEFVNLEDMQCYSFPTSTMGGFRCIRELDDRIKRMRWFKGQNVYPTVRLTHTHMPTRFGGRERPHLEIKEWHKIGGREAEALPPPQAPLPPPQQEQVAGQASPPQAQAVSQAETVKIQPVSEPALQEELNDKVPF